MPHVGGGSCGGGFHSGSSGTSSSTPKYDNHGNLHSSYYVRPGFYYNKIYVPYESKKRGFSYYIGNVFAYLFALIFLGLMIVLISDVGHYSQDKLEDYALNQYSKIYDSKSSSYEYNLLVTIVAYEDNNQYDYVSIVGDNVIKAVDLSFGSDKTLFGAELAKNVNHSNYYETLYSNIAKSVDAIIEDLPNQCYTSNTLESKIVNESGFGEISGKEELVTAEAKFYERTGYHISFLVTNNKIVYKLEILPIVLMGTIAVVVTFANSYSIHVKRKAVKEVNAAIKRNEGAIYFEGEDDFETYNSQFPYKKF